MSTSTRSIPLSGKRWRCEIGETEPVLLVLLNKSDRDGWGQTPVSGF